MIISRGREGDSLIEKLARQIFELNETLQEMGSDTNLFEAGVLDSLDFSTFILYVEELRGEPIPAGEVVPESFASLEAIVQAFFNSHASH